MVNHKILETAERGVILLATAGVRGDVHAAVVGRIEAPGDNRLTIHEWLCPKTLGNLQDNRRGTLIIWDPAADEGYQLPVHVANVAFRSAILKTSCLLVAYLKLTPYIKHY